MPLSSSRPPAAPSNGTPSPFQPELVVGLIGPVGSGLAELFQHVATSLRRHDYKASRLRVSATFHDLLPQMKLPVGKSKRSRADYEALMDAGDLIRRTAERNDAALFGALNELRRQRRSLVGDVSRPASRTAFVLDSIKTPEELALLRWLYQDRFVAISAFSPVEQRRTRLKDEFRDASPGRRAIDHEADATAVIRRDESDTGNQWGQDVSAAFWQADLFIDMQTSRRPRNQVERFFDLLFGYQFGTPTKDEYGMYLAFASALRSASMSRQVGAAILRPDGAVVSIGTNEVARAGGGHYWSGEDPDARDFLGEEDTGFKYRRRLLNDTLEALRTLGAVSDETLDIAKLKDLPVFDIIEYYREVHAEMSAVADAARHGVSTLDCHLYTTTFPCHDCAKHIVATGIARVVFVEPYPKSLVSELYSDSIRIGPASKGVVGFETFIGVAPRQYQELFRMNRRKDDEGRKIEWSGAIRVGGSSGQLEDRRLQRLLLESEFPRIVQRESAVFSLYQSTLDRLKTIKGAIN
jgi:deoxycytidylate deaminase